jgi:hypothetical protein
MYLAKTILNNIKLRMASRTFKHGLPNLRNRIGCLALGLLTMISSMNFAQPISDEISAAIKVPIFLKVLSFDRQLKARAGKSLNMFIVYQSKYRYSQSERDEIENVLDNLSINSIEGIPINYFYIDIDEENFQSEVAKWKIDLMLVCPLRGFSLSTIASVCRGNKILSFADISSYVDYGLSVGIEMKAEKPQIIINIKSAKAEGAEFSSQLLKLARVIE